MKLGAAVSDKLEGGVDWKSFSRKTWVIILSGIFLPPVGILLAWLKPDWSQRTKWIATGLICFALFGRLNSSAEKQVEDSGTVSQVIDESETQKATHTSEARATAAINGDKELDLMLLLKVKLGMSESQVQSILGPPHQVNRPDLSAFPYFEKQLETWTYNPDKDNWAVLGFENGQLFQGGSGGYEITEAGGPSGLKMVDEINKILDR